MHLVIPQIGLIPGPQNLHVCDIAKIQETDLHINTKRSFTIQHQASDF
jgi:hypothetical protein